MVKRPIFTHLESIPSQKPHWFQRYVCITKWAPSGPIAANMANKLIFTHSELIPSENHHWLLRYVKILNFREISRIFEFFENFENFEFFENFPQNP